MRNATLVLCFSVTLASCAGRDPEAIATVQPWDQTASCTQLRAEIEANNIKITELAGEQGTKVAQNVITGVGGLVIPVLWFGMDWKGSASKDVAALQARQQYLTILATDKCKVEAEKEEEKATKKVKPKITSSKPTPKPKEEEQKTSEQKD